MIKKLLFISLLTLPMSMAFGTYELAKSYASGFYAGAGGGYVWVKHNLKYTNDGTIANRTKKVTKSIVGAGVINGYLGYGYVFQHGNLPYLGAEVGYSHFTTYDKKGYYSSRVNMTQVYSFDLMPGWFLDDANTILIYGRLGIGYATYRLSGDYSGTKTEPLLRAGAGFEHEFTHNIYMRAGYTFEYASQRALFSVNGDKEHYRAQPWFQVIDLGISYRFSSW